MLGLFRRLQIPKEELFMANCAQARKRARQASDAKQAQCQPQVVAAHRGQEGKKGDRRRRQDRGGRESQGIAIGHRPHRGQEDRAQEPRIANEVASRAGDQGDALAKRRIRGIDRRDRPSKKGASGRPFSWPARAHVVSMRETVAPAWWRERDLRRRESTQTSGCLRDRSTQAVDDSGGGERVLPRVAGVESRCSGVETSGTAIARGIVMPGASG